MAEPHIISALHERRAEVCGVIRAPEKCVKQCRADLAHPDAAIRLFDGVMDPDAIKPERGYRQHMTYFNRRELFVAVNFLGRL